ncbi:MAG TPA: hypothetical protein VJ738_06275, partial [Steroidobacteraceae bacterium]|nr:hypothetical protein [Steroidobacteraceae bacterium]
GSRESANVAVAASPVQENGAPESSTDARSNGAQEQHQGWAGREQASATPETREPAREATAASAAHHERAAAPLAHFEPSPPTESNAPRESKPYVVWSSAPPDEAVSGGGRGPEE